MLPSNRLRVDLDDGSRAVDYRIEFGCVESRIVESVAEKSAISKSRGIDSRLTNSAHT